MATVLLTWELGGGLGHLTNLRPFAQGFLDRGHRVVAALRDCTRADLLGAQVEVIFAPICKTPVPTAKDPVLNFADLLHNVGFDEPAGLLARCEAWSQIFHSVAPDLTLFDHSPTALLASRAYSTRRALVGTGFFCPPHGHALPRLREDLDVSEAVLRSSERVVLDRVNAVLRHYGRAPLASISQLYADADENFLLTFAELDHYSSRLHGRYRGAWPNIPGKPVSWPLGTGPRIYAYLKPFAALGTFLTELRGLRCPTLVFVDSIRQETQRQFQCEHLTFEQQPLDLTQIGQECDVAILNANHGTTVSMLMAGKPILQIPLSLEQALLARAVERLGAGRCVSPAQPEQFGKALRDILDTTKYRNCARQFANEHAGYNQDQEIRTLIDDSERLAQGGADAKTQSTRDYEPLDLIHPRRFDLTAKILYARHRVKGTKVNWMRSVYLEHIQVMNGFQERHPRKQGPEQFLRSFDSLIDTLSAEAEPVPLQPIPIATDGSLLNGAHRVAACLAGKRTILGLALDRSGYDFSAAWFHTHRINAIGGLSLTSADLMALEYCRLRSDDVKLLIIPAAAPAYRGLVEQLRGSGLLVYAKAVRLTELGLANFERCLRDLDTSIEISWLAETAQDLRVLVIHPCRAEQPQQLAEVKRRLNDEAAVVASSKAMVGLSQLLLSENSLTWLNQCSPKIWKMLGDIASSVAHELDSAGVTADDCSVLVNAKALESEHRDLQRPNWICFKGGEVVNQAGDHVAIEEEERIFNVDRYFWFRGLKFNVATEPIQTR